MTNQTEEPTEADKLVEEIEDFCMRHGLAESTFSRRAAGHPNFASELRAGTVSPTLRTVDRVRKYMKQHNFVREPSNG